MLVLPRPLFNRFPPRVFPRYVITTLRFSPADELADRLKVKVSEIIDHGSKAKSRDPLLDLRIGKHRRYLTVPKDEEASVQKISGHRAIAFVKQAEALRAGTITKGTPWQPYAVFDTDSGALVQTLLVPQSEEGPVCYSTRGGRPTALSRWR